jgi:hypothetical protein
MRGKNGDKEKSKEEGCEKEGHEEARAQGMLLLLKFFSCFIFQNRFLREKLHIRL